jgi:undecaprenyl diphosphate synthase
VLEIGGERLQHIAIIMDGNRRWARRKGWAAKQGYEAGVETLKKTIKWCCEMELLHLTVYVFSTENWLRATDEVEDLMFLICDSFAKYAKEAKENNVRISVWGRKERLSAELINIIERIKNDTKDCTGLNLNLCFNYGGRQEIVDAVHVIAQDLIDGNLRLCDVTAEALAKKMYASTAPDPDLIVRSGGECRLSNFLSWQCIYSELVFLDVLWPDFAKDDLELAVAEFYKRKRRFGGR